jgi:hypothetical protein
LSFNIPFATLGAVESMFPPLEQKMLQSNPDFAKLYRVITTAILNPDGSTKEDAEAKDRAAVQKVSTNLDRASSSRTPIDDPVSSPPPPRAWTSIVTKQQGTTS